MSVFKNLTVRGMVIGLGFFLMVPGSGARVKKQPSPTAVAAPAPTGHVIAVDVHVDWGAKARPCPRSLAVRGTITTDGPAEVRYSWVSSDQRSQPPERLLGFTAAGTHEVSEQWSVGEAGQAYSVWMMLRVVYPNQMASQRQSSELLCEAPSHHK